MPSESVGTVQAWFEAWNARDFEALRALYSPVAAYRRPDGFSQGPEAIVAYLRDIVVDLPGETAVVDAVVVTPEVIAVEWSALQGGEDGGPRAHMAEFFRFQDGRILSQHQFGDPVRTVRLLTSRRNHAGAAQAPVAAPGATMVGFPAPSFEMPAPPAPAKAAPEPDQDWGPGAVETNPQLTVAAGPDQGVTFTLGDAPLTLGRARDNDIALDDPCTSGHHARFERDGEEVIVVDLGSTNGTYVNGKQVQRQQLQDGDRITVGGNSLTYAGPPRSARTEASLEPISA